MLNSAILFLTFLVEEQEIWPLGGNILRIVCLLYTKGISNSNIEYNHKIAVRADSPSMSYNLIRLKKQNFVEISMVRLPGDSLSDA